MRRGDFVVFKNEDKDVWPVGWHDNIFKSYLTTHGTTLPGKPADKRDKTKTQTLILHCKFQGLPVSRSTTNKWVPLIVTIVSDKAFCAYTWPGEQNLGKHGFKWRFWLLH
jgi:hypothetical protein